MSENPPDGDRPEERPEAEPASRPEPGGPLSDAGSPPPPGPPPGAAGPPPGQYGRPSDPYGPPGGYTGPPQGPPGGYPGAPQAGSAGYPPLPPEPQATTAFGFAWKAFVANAGTLILGQLAWALIVVAITALWMVLLSGTGIIAFGTQSEAAIAGGVVAVAVSAGAVLVVTVFAGIVAAAGMSNATLKLVRGEQITVADFFRIPNLGAVILVALLLGLASGILSITFVGPIILTFFAAYIIVFAIDQRHGIGEAITSGVRMAVAFPGQTVLVLLLAYVANFVGTLLCGVGVLVSLPLTALAVAWLYRSQLPLMQARQ